MEYHYTCIRVNLHQIDHHLQEIESQCKQLEMQLTSAESSMMKLSVDNENKSMRRSRIYDETPILTPSFMRTVDEFFVLEASLQRTSNQQSAGQEVLLSNLANKSKKPHDRNQQQPTPWDETML